MDDNNKTMKIVDWNDGKLKRLIEKMPVYWGIKCIEYNGVILGSSLLLCLKWAISNLCISSMRMKNCASYISEKIEVSCMEQYRAHCGLFTAGIYPYPYTISLYVLLELN